MNVRSATVADQAEWVRMRCALWPWADPEELAQEVAAYFRSGRQSDAGLLAEGVLVCARQGGGLQGVVEVSVRPFAEGCLTDRVGYIEGWYVDPDARQTGVGRALVAAAEAWARAQGCTEMASDVEVDNAISQAAHGQLGYKEVGRVVQYMKELA